MTTEPAPLELGNERNDPAVTVAQGYEADVKLFVTSTDEIEIGVNG